MSSQNAVEKKANRNSIDMLHGPLVGKLFLFAIPLAFSSIFQQLFNSTDAIVAGRLLGSTELAAIGGVSPLVALFISFFVGVSIGTNATIAIRIGQGDRSKIRAAVHTTAVIAIVSAVLVTVIGIAIAGFLVDSVGIPDEARAESVSYLRIYFAGVAFFLVFNFGSAILRAKGDTRRPLYALAISAVVNAVLDIFAVSVLHLGAAGIAAATVAAYALAAVIVIVMLMHEEEDFRLNVRELRVDQRALHQILYIGVPSGLQGVVFAVSNIIIQTSINSFGTDAIAGSTAALNFEYYTYFIINAFSQAAITFVGQNFAAGNLSRCDRIVAWSMGLSLGLSFAVSVALVSLGNTGLSIFTTEAGALVFATTRLWHVELLECLPSTYEITAGALRGMSWSILPTVVVIIGSCVLRVIYVFTLFPLLGSFEALLNIYPVTWIVTGTTMIALYLFARKRTYAKERAKIAARKQKQAARSSAAA